MITMRGLLAWYHLLPSTMAVARMSDAGAIRLGVGGPGAEEMHARTTEALEPE